MDDEEMEIDLPEIHIGPDVLSDFDKAIQTEWIVTNGLGGYASSTVLGINTRKFHGLMVAASNPPVDRNVILTKLDEEFQIENKVYFTGANELKSGIQPSGSQSPSSFSLNPLPTYRYVAHGFELQKRIFMPHGKNTTVVMYESFNPNRSGVVLHISPLLSFRHFYSVTKKENLGWSFVQKPFEKGVIVKPSVQPSPLILFSSKGQYSPNDGKWIRDVLYRVDCSRGESCVDDSFRPGKFELRIAPKERKEFFVIAAKCRSEKEAQTVLSSICRESNYADVLYNQELIRLENLLATFRKQYADVKMEDWLKWLVLVADSFLVERASTKTKSVIAGYHWFEDWGRDSMISLPALTLVTGRFEVAEKILLTFKRYCSKGLIPNRFPDQAGDTPLYNTVDATLWYFNAVLQYLKYTGNFDFVRKQQWESLQSIIEHHIHGTNYNVRMDDDGLIAHGPQLTWMDAMTGDQPVTPRNGKAVEIQALWYNALKVMELLATRFNQKLGAEKYRDLAEKTRNSLAEKFWNSRKHCLFDVICEGQRDKALRPNQVIAVALDFTMLDRTRAKEVVETVRRELWGKYGLRTLSKDNPQYIGKYIGDWTYRNRAYHNGTVWAWLLGPFTTAFLKVKEYEKRWRNFAFQNFLKPLFQEKTFKGGLGTISEIFDGDSPHASRGCVSQAWSVAEPLRAFIEDVLLKRPPYERQILTEVT
ncbi:MAG: glycogen debranching enzyme family protein [Candidatus Bathyarchaeota archaeon]|nr:MAG: glycogen debranching enzyme family protein [Candidatus Bathyarchaeota archaeon]